MAKATAKKSRKQALPPGTGTLGSRKPWRQEIQGLTAPLHVFLETTTERCSAALRFRSGKSEQPGAMTLWPGYAYTVTYHFSSKSGQWRLAVEQRPAATPATASLAEATIADAAPRVARSVAAPELPSIALPAAGPADMALPPDPRPATPTILNPTIPNPPIPAPGLNAPGLNAPGLNAPGLDSPGANPPEPLPPSPFPRPPVGMCHCRETGMYRECPDGHNAICSAVEIQCVPSSPGLDGEGT
ncbi:MAG: hypothetical protein RLY70_2227 [Planctomycetota bacterium]|jgi:hypothetical protein